MSRVRNQSFSNSGGGTRKRAISGTIITNNLQAPFQVYNSTCTDEPGPYKVNRLIIDKPMDIDRVERKFDSAINGRFDSGSSFQEYINWFPELMVTASVNHLTDTLDSDTAVATATLARSNPGRSHVSLPNFVYELKDLPGMIRDIGHIKLIGQRAFSKAHWNGGVPATPRDAANLQLSYQMGWSPLISDLANLLQFRADVEKKATALRNLYENGGLHRTVGKADPKKGRSGSWSSTTSTSTTQVIESALSASFVAKWETITSAKKWGSTRWMPNTYPDDHFNYEDYQRKSMRLVLGLNPNPKIIWDAIPWSWLVDWFGNVGDFLSTTGYTIQAQPTTPCVMYQRETVIHVTPLSGPSWCSWGGGSLTRTTLRRRVVSAGLSASLPFFTGRQLSILGALAIQRLR